jgi:hypothetical protein
VDVAKAMLEIAEADRQAECAKFIEKHFKFREVLGTKAFAGLPDLSSLGLYADRRGCCDTMQHPEYKPKLPS